MKYNILVAGVGGMGILTASKIICEAALLEEKNVVMSEVHGLSQRFGMVNTNIRIGDVHAPLIKEGDADVVLGLEPIEALRFSYMVKKNHGYIIVNLNPVPPPAVSAGFEKYPSVESIVAALKKVVKRIIAVNALKYAEKLGNPLLQNTILLGILFSLEDFPLKKESGEKAIEKIFEKNEKLIELNKRAFEIGYKIGLDKQKNIF